VSRTDPLARLIGELERLPGIGPKTAKLLYEKEGITGVGRLEALARAGKLRGLPGIQAKTEQNILRGIEVVRKGQERMALGKALPLARELVRALARSRRGTSVVLVAHSEVIAAYLGEVRGTPAPRRYPPGLANGSITVVDVVATGAETIRLTNHVPAAP